MRTSRIAQFTGIAQQLEACSSRAVLMQIPGAGRGLVASQEIPQGTEIHTEIPLVSTPSPGTTSCTCYACLKPLPAIDGGTDGVFCSDQCHQHAEDNWWKVEQQGDFSDLHTSCGESGQKFPLLAARLACSEIQTGIPASKKLEHLCFANMAEPPEPWIATFSLLQKGLASLPPSLNTNRIDLQWYCWVLARIHINAFRVDTIPLLGAGQDSPSEYSSMLRAAAMGAMGEGGGEAALGSAVYNLGSMFNHSCEPNVEVVFPKNDHQASFVAAADIDGATELTISYIDAGLERAARQHSLQFAYGFTCQCPRCREEL